MGYDIKWGVCERVWVSRCIYLLTLEDIHGMYTIYDISKYIYLVYDMPTTKSLPGIAGDS